METTPTDGPYTAYARIGAGGQAEVYAGVRESWGLTQPVALKFLRDELVAKPLHRRRFQREAEIGLALNHPNIVNTHVLDESGGQPVLVLELVGPSVRAVKESLVGRWDLISVIAEDALEAVTCLRRQGVVHRDISAGNLLLDPSGDVKLADFGVATRYDGTDTPAAVAGSIPSVSPELLRGERGTDASDLFSIGAVLFELGTGEAPFGTDFQSVVEGHRQGVPAIPGNVPRRLRALFRGLLEIEPQHRIRLEDAKRLLRPTSAAARADLGGLSRPWLKECCPAVRHPLDGVRTYGAAVELPARVSGTRWRRLAGPGMGAVATACTAAAFWLVMEPRALLETNVTSAPEATVTDVNIGRTAHLNKRAAPTRPLVKDGPAKQLRPPRVPHRRDARPPAKRVRKDIREPRKTSARQHEEPRTVESVVHNTKTLELAREMAMDMYRGDAEWSAHSDGGGVHYSSGEWRGRALVMRIKPTAPFSPSIAMLERLSGRFGTVKPDGWIEIVFEDARRLGIRTRVGIVLAEGAGGAWLPVTLEVR